MIDALPPPSHFEQFILSPVEMHETLLTQLLEEGYVAWTGEDAVLRPLFVGLQGAVEAYLTTLLRSGEFKEVLGCIHTIAPCTALCVRTEEEAHDILHPTLQEAPGCLETVSNRTRILYQFLDAGGRLDLIYDKDGREQRTEEQLQVLADTLWQYYENLDTVPVDYAKLREDLRAEFVPGASYVAIPKEGPLVYFSIQAPQAHAPQDDLVWKMWLGTTDNPRIAERLCHYLHFTLELHP